MVFFDTGVVLKLVVQEPLSARVLQTVERNRWTIPLTRLIDLEMENALQALFYRKSISAEQLAGARELVAELVSEGLFRRVDLSLDEVSTEAFSLASIVTPKSGCRTLDLLHVASAKLLRAPTFVSADARQNKAARILGMKVKDFRQKSVG